MSEQSEVWAVQGGSGRFKCPKHGIMVSGCTKDMGCEACISGDIVVKKRLK